MLARSDQRGNGFREEERVDLSQRQFPVLEGMEERGIGARAGAERFEGQGAAAGPAQMAEQQSGQDRLANAGVSAGNERDSRPSRVAHSARFKHKPARMETQDLNGKERRGWPLTPAAGAPYTGAMADAGKLCAQQRFRNFLAQRNLRLTAQRRTIIETAFSTEQHFTAEQLLEWSRQRDKSVSRATVYRTLPLLTESGLVREMDFGKEQRFYDPNYAEHPRHNHVICEDCQKIVEFESDQLERLVDEASQKLGFSVESHRLQITAHCNELRERGVCGNKAG